ncbi:MAG: cell division ATPase MinD [Haloferacaceae archaeon]
MGRVYAVASGKGGVGKTATTANLGSALAAAGHETVVVDADLGMANLGSALGVADDGPTLHDVLAGEATIAEAVRRPPDRPAVLPGSRDLDDFADADPGELAGVLDTLADEYDHVLVDTGAGLSTDSLAPLRAADEVVLVSTPDPAALDDTAKTATVTRRLGTPLRGFVIVRARGERTERARERLDGEVLETVPDDDAVTEAMEAGIPLVEYAPRSPATHAYRRLAATLTGAEVPEAEEPGAGASDATAARPDEAEPEPGGTEAQPGPDAGVATPVEAESPASGGEHAPGPDVEAATPDRVADADVVAGGGTDGEGDGTDAAEVEDSERAGEGAAAAGEDEATEEAGEEPTEETTEEAGEEPEEDASEEPEEAGEEPAEEADEEPEEAGEEPAEEADEEPEEAGEEPEEDADEKSKGFLSRLFG